MQRALPHILVDEYQDINRAQFELLKLLAPPGHDVLAVADEAQSIYGWRGAQPGLIADFRRHYHPDRHRAGAELPVEPDHPLRGRAPDPSQLARGCPRCHGFRRRRRRRLAHLPLSVRDGTTGANLGHAVGAQACRRSAATAMATSPSFIAPINWPTHWRAASCRPAFRWSASAGRASSRSRPCARSCVTSTCCTPWPTRVERAAPGAFLAAFNFPQTLAGELTVLQLDRLAATHRLPLAELARRSAHFPELSPLTRAQLQGFVGLLDEQVVAGADAGCCGPPSPPSSTFWRAGAARLPPRSRRCCATQRYS